MSSQIGSFGYSRVALAGAVLCAAALTAGCVVAPPPQPVVAQVRQPVYPAYPQYGQVVAIDKIRLGRSPTGAGAVIGGVAGAVVGNQFGRGGGRAGMTALGAIGGAMVGNQIEAQNSAYAGPDAYRISVRLNDGSVRAFDYEQLGEVRLGSRVRVEDNKIFLY